MEAEPIIFSDTALVDIEFIEAYISQDSPAIAKKYVLQIFDAIEQIGQFPKSGRVVPEFMIESIREIIFGKYRIIYQTEPHYGIFILRIIHGSRLLDLSDFHV